MPDSPLVNVKRRFPEVLAIRMPKGFLDRIRTAATAEGIEPPDFARLAIAERLARNTAPGGSPASDTPERTDHHV